MKDIQRGIVGGAAPPPPPPTHQNRMLIHQLFKP
jgi:hypothetical protein